MKVELIAYTQRPGAKPGQNPLSVVEQAACMCYDSKQTESNAIAKSCAKSGHTSVLEHISFTFQVSGVSRALLAQLTRHRLASYTVRSQRYCEERGFGYVDPTKGSPLFERAMSLSDLAYRALRKLNIPAEDARMVLPNACHTQLVVTMNARALINASHERLCTRAQWEIRELFKQMKAAVEPVCPEVAGWMRPKCEEVPEYPFCRETKSCGRHPKLEKVYRAPESEESGFDGLMPEEDYRKAIECRERRAGITDCGSCPLYGVIDCSYILAKQTRKRLETNGGVCEK